MIDHPIAANTADATSVLAIAAVFMDYVPHITALFTLVLVIFRLYQMAVESGFIKGHKTEKKKKKKNEDDDDDDAE